MDDVREARLILELDPEKVLRDLWWRGDGPGIIGSIVNDTEVGWSLHAIYYSSGPVKEGQNPKSVTVTIERAPADGAS